jgi:hypothetical protein
MMEEEAPINIVGEAEDPERCWKKDPHPRHPWASQVMGGDDGDVIMFDCPGV